MLNELQTNSDLCYDRYASGLFNELRCLVSGISTEKNAVENVKTCYIFIAYNVMIVNICICRL